MIAAHVVMISQAHPIELHIRKDNVGSPVNILEDAWIGPSVIILPGVTMDQGAVAAADSVVTDNVSDVTIAARSPAQIIRHI